MADSLKETILDYQEADLLTGIPRRVRVTSVLSWDAFVERATHLRR